MKGFYGYQSSIIEPELESAIRRASEQLKRCPQVSEIDFGLNYLGQPSDLELVDEISHQYGLELHVYPHGKITVGRHRPRHLISVNGRHAEPHRRTFKLRRVTSHLHLPHWNAGFEGLSEGIR